MKFISYMLWLLASFFLLALWSAVGLASLGFTDSFLIRAVGPDSTPLWVAYVGLVFLNAVWPALLLVLTHGKRPLGRMVRGWILVFALVNLILGTLMAFAVVDSGTGMTVFSHELSTAFDALLAGALYAGGVVAVEGYFKRRRIGDQHVELELGSV